MIIFEIIYHDCDWTDKGLIRGDAIQNFAHICIEWTIITFIWRDWYILFSVVLAVMGDALPVLCSSVIGCRMARMVTIFIFNQMKNYLSKLGQIDIINTQHNNNH